MPRSPRILGLMSGTSADGVDCVLLELTGFPALGSSTPPPALEALPTPRARILGQTYTPYPDALRSSVLHAMRGEATTPELAQLHVELGAFYGQAALELSSDAELIACHGQTVYHIPQPDPARGWYTRSSLQLGEAAVLAELTGRDVIADFRPADLAAGGQAAPLVPFADRILFAQAGERRAIHNLGGISNLTYLPGLDAAGVLAFDTGPANCLSDEVAAHSGRRFDAGGSMALSGRVEPRLLERWLSDAYFAQPPPKSTGRERWNLDTLAALHELEPRDQAATVTEFAVRSALEGYRRFVLPLGLDAVYVGGGGVHNPVLMGGLTRGLAPTVVYPLEALDFPASAREAAAFAVLGYYARQGWSNTLPHTTGARRAVVAGKWTRFAPQG